MTFGWETLQSTTDADNPRHAAPLHDGGDGVFDFLSIYLTF